MAGVARYPKNKNGNNNYKSDKASAESRTTRKKKNSSAGKKTERTAYSISQNFLTSSVVISKLLNLTDIGKDDHVVDIGAGKGHITRELLKACGYVTAYEADRNLADNLKVAMGGDRRLNLINRDFLRSSLPAKGEYKVFSNIPFSITSDIIRKLTQAIRPPKDIWIVMEKGAAIRFMGKKYDTPASLSIKPFYDMEITYSFSKKDFHPEPSVNTVLVHFHKKEKPDIPVSQRKKFAQFIDISQKYGLRKTLTPKQISAALKGSGLSPLDELEELSYPYWLAFFRMIK